VDIIWALHLPIKGNLPHHKEHLEIFYTYNEPHIGFYVTIDMEIMWVLFKGSILEGILLESW